MNLKFKISSLTLRVRKCIFHDIDPIAEVKLDSGIKLAITPSQTHTWNYVCKECLENYKKYYPKELQEWNYLAKEPEEE